MQLSKRKLKGWLATFVVVGASLIPVDFVAVPSVLTILAALLLIVGAALGLMLLIESRAQMLLFATGYLLMLLAFSALSSGSVAPIYSLGAPFLAGVALALARPEVSPNALVIAVAVIVASLLLDTFAGAHVYSEAIGQPFQMAVAGDVFRARGVIGQPVPGAIIVVVLTVLTFLVTAQSKEHVNAFRAAVLLLCGAALAATGTRSGILLLFLGLSVTFPTWRRTVSGWHVAAALGIASVSLLAVAQLGAPASFRWGSGDELVFTQSYVNRTYAFEVFRIWRETCQSECLLIGNGARDLQVTLGASLGLYGFSTVDNLFLSVLWDFGLLGLLGLLALFCWSLVVVLKGSSIEAKVGAAGVTLIVLSGAFFDALYIRPLLILFGYCAAMMLATALPRPVTQGEMRRA